VNRTSTAVRSWTAADVERYAAAVGGTGVLPTFAITIAQFGGPQVDLGADLTQTLHAEQSLTLHGELPLEGTVEVTRTITDVFDKGSGSLIVCRWDAVGDARFSTGASLFVKGAGGFGGPRGTTTRDPVPDREPDVSLTFRTAPNQADRYRLTGDENRLHWDAEFAARAGFPRPILHGLATFGITARLLDLDTASISARFTQPVFPGDELQVNAWHEECGVRFRTSVEGTVVINDGRATPSS
jgi:acyl dehydratase